MKVGKRPKKMSENVKNQSFGVKKPVSPQNQKFLEVNFRDFPSFRLYFNKNAWATRGLIITVDEIFTLHIVTALK